MTPQELEKIHAENDRILSLRFEKSRQYYRDTYNRLAIAEASSATTALVTPKAVKAFAEHLRLVGAAQIQFAETHIRNYPAEAKRFLQIVGRVVSVSCTKCDEPLEENPSLEAFPFDTVCQHVISRPWND